MTIIIEGPSSLIPNDYQIFPMMLIGIVGMNVLRVMDPADTRSIGVLLASYFFQGEGDKDATALTITHTRMKAWDSLSLSYIL